MFSAIPHIITSEDAVASIEAMRMQEESGYKTEDYMFQAQPEVRVHKGPQQQPVDTECRSKMSEWCFQVVDFCKFNRETVAIAMNYLDRFLMTPAGNDAMKNRKVFQLAAMTSLYTAIKIHEPEAMEPKVIASLSRGAYTEDEVTAMELRILSAIKWRMNPPTAMAFVHYFLSLLPQGAMTDSEKAGAIELAKFQTELAVNTYEFVGVNASTIAFGSLSNALNCCNLDCEVECELLNNIAQVACINSHSHEMVSVQDNLYNAVQGASSCSANSVLRPSPTITKNMACDMGNIISSIHTSPRSVSAPN